MGNAGKASTWEEGLDPTESVLEEMLLMSLVRGRCLRSLVGAQSKCLDICNSPSSDQLTMTSHQQLECCAAPLDDTFSKK